MDDRGRLTGAPQNALRKRSLSGRPSGSTRSR
jgi:hypothetical protein